MFVVERARVVERRGLEVRVGAADSVLIRVAWREGIFEHQLVHPPVRPVLRSLPLFVDHHGPLPVQVLLRQVLLELRELVGLQPQHPLQAARGDSLAKLCVVVLGAPPGSRGSDSLRDDTEVVRRVPALVQQVFEKVCQSGVARLLVFRANAVTEVEVHDGRLAVDVQDHIHSVGQRVMFDGEIRDLGVRETRYEQAEATAA